MKLNPSRHNTEGSVLLVTVITLFVLTTMAVSYLFMLQNDNRFVARDQAWNRALVVAEAGVEEAMAHINSGGALLAPLQNFSGDSWSLSGTNYAMQRPGDLYGGGYSVIVGGPTNIATITSTGMVTAPLSATTLHRIVQVTASFTSGFQVGIAAISSINLNGNNIVIDSYDSSNTNLFTNGLYNVQHRQDHGDVATLTTNQFSIGNNNIMGKVHMPPSATINDVAFGHNGAVGDVAWANPTARNTGFESPSYFVNDFNTTFPDVSVPYTSGTAVSSPSTGRTNTLSTGTYYYNGNFSFGNNGVLDVSAYSYVELYVTGNFDMGTAGSLIKIEPGATLVLYVGGATAKFQTINNGGNANNFQYYGLPSNTSITMSGNSSYIGTVYAPEASITFNGGGSNTIDYQGAMVVNNLTSNGHFNMHYDENLAREPIAGIYVAGSWTELTH